jgi:hypothetical protein
MAMMDKTRTKRPVRRSWQQSRRHYIQDIISKLSRKDQKKNKGDARDLGRNTRVNSFHRDGESYRKSTFLEVHLKKSILAY